MVINTRARYKRRPDHGLIRVTRFFGKKPVEYSLQLYKENQGFINLKKATFATLEEAKGYATLHGYSLALWEIEEKKV